MVHNRSCLTLECISIGKYKVSIFVIIKAFTPFIADESGIPFILKKNKGDILTQESLLCTFYKGRGRVLLVLFYIPKIVFVLQYQLRRQIIL
jgi:hypothetical protein